MNKLFLSLLSLLIFFSFVSACDTGCVQGGVCYNYGDQILIGQVNYYCDYLTDSFKLTKASGSCDNDFECNPSYNCISATCTRYFSDLIEANSLIQSYISGACPVITGGDYFCSNVTGLTNANLFVNLSCGDDAAYSCYTCKNGYYNSTLGSCITGICKSTPGCLSSPINNSVNSTEYCSDNKKCYSCESSDYLWNATIGDCILRNCDSTPGCMNLTNLSNAFVTGLKCPSDQSCFRCNSNRAWDVNSSSCILATISDSAWYDVSFSVTDLDLGSYKPVSSRDKIAFTFASRSYYFGLLSVNTKISFEIGIDSASGNVTPLIRNQVMYPGESRNFDLDSDGTYDLKVGLNNISSGKANISLKFISENYVVGDDDSDNTYDYSDDSGYVEDSSLDTQVDSGSDLELEGSAANESFVQRNLTVISVLGLIIVLLLIGLLFFLLKKSSMAKKASETQTPASSSPSQPRPPVAPSNVPTSYPVGGYRPLPVRPVQPVQPVPQQK
jgi:hypothetical protein